MTDKTKDSILLQITEVLGPLLERQGSCAGGIGSNGRWRRQRPWLCVRRRACTQRPCAFCLSGDSRDLRNGWGMPLSLFRWPAPRALQERLQPRQRLGERPSRLKPLLHGAAIAVEQQPHAPALPRYGTVLAAGIQTKNGKRNAALAKARYSKPSRFTAR
ncbi:hypothetical protein L3067_06815 [Xanthomonas sp. PPL568]|uniref:hypothetical protein n=1 Tax=Xanthomonas indica TaxID=2912242 RepID=UPI001F57ADFE|nr:hypothetical protein [Xanthomonas indica]MCI2244320.1 hypothetical protein [Xanthomonas indica]